MAKVWNKFTGFEDMAMRIKPAEKPTHKRPRHQAPEHLKFIRGLSCLTCGLPDHSDPHHLKPACYWAAKPSSGTMKPNDSWTVPLCRLCHNECEQWSAGEWEWWCLHSMYGIDYAFKIALALWEATGDYERGEQIIRANR